MKLAFIINDLSGGGAEKALKLLSDFLVQAGLEVVIVTLQSGEGEYELNSAIPRIALRSGRAARGAGRVLALPLQAAELARTVRAWQPDVCVSFLPRSNIAHVMTRSFGNRRPVLLTEQISSRDNYPSAGVGDRIMRALIAYFYPRADAVLPSSRGVLDGLTGFGVAPELMHVVYNPVSLRDIQARAVEPVHDGWVEPMPTIITVGRCAAQKDHATLLRAFALARARVAARLVIVGQGPLRADLEALARTLGVAEAVHFAGWQRNPFAWMARSDLFVLSSRFEGFGNVLVEAMACGLPVISTDCPSGPREILKDGSAGVLVPAGDVIALADAMTRVLCDRALRDQLGRAARHRAPDFDISVIGPQYAALVASYAHGDRTAA